MERERVTVQEAAKRLGITESAIRKRVQRGQLEHDKDQDGRLYVHLDMTETERDTVREFSYDMLVRRLENENEFLRRELERKDSILMNMTEAMKALTSSTPTDAERPPDEREAPVTSTEEESSSSPSTEQQQPTSRRSWLYRFFIGPD